MQSELQQLQVSFYQQKVYPLFWNTHYFLGFMHCFSSATSSICTWVGSHYSLLWLY